MAGRRWTGREDAVLRATYGTVFAWEIAGRLGRTEDAVWLRARTLGLDKRPAVTPWTDREISELKRCCSTDKPAQIAARLGRTPSSIYQQARYLGLVSRKTLAGQSVISDYFDNIDNLEKAYILGLFAADGNVMDNGRITFGLQARDADAVRYMRDRIALDIALHVTSRRSFVSFSVVSRPLAAGLAQWGVIPRKSRCLSWPAELGDFLRPFLLGYFDGDGSIHAVRNRYPGWSICSGSEQFLIDAKEYIRFSTGVLLEKIQHRRNSDLYQVMTTGSGAYLVNEWLHQENLGFARKRFPDHIAERYRTSPTGGKAWTYPADLRLRSTKMVRDLRRINGVVYGDITRVANEIGVPPYALRYWVKRDESSPFGQ